MKQENKITRFQGVSSTSLLLLLSSKLVEGFIPNVSEIYALNNNQLFNYLDLSKHVSWNSRASSLSMTVSIDTISTSIRSLGSWYSAEDPIASSSQMSYE